MSRVSTRDEFSRDVARFARSPREPPSALISVRQWPWPSRWVFAGGYACRDRWALDDLPEQTVGASFSSYRENPPAFRFQRNFAGGPRCFRARFAEAERSAIHPAKSRGLTASGSTAHLGHVANSCERIGLRYCCLESQHAPAEVAEVAEAAFPWCFRRRSRL